MFFPLPHSNSTLPHSSPCLCLSSPLPDPLLESCAECFNPRESGIHVMTDTLESSSCRAPLRLEYLCISLISSLHIPQTFIKPSFVFAHTPPPSLSPIHFISLHPILCLRAEGSDSIPTGLLLWRFQHHLPLRGEGGHPRQPAHCWRYSHHWTNGETRRKETLCL